MIQSKAEGNFNTNAFFVPSLATVLHGLSRSWPGIDISEGWLGLFQQEVISQFRVCFVSKGNTVS